ncbi:hypothetical protein ACI68E_002354 [Malassezia pachydermatis]
MITAATLNLPSTLPVSKFIEHFKITCMSLRFRHPVLALTIETNIFNIPLLPCYLYDPVASFTDVEQWASRAIFVHSPKTEDEKAQSIGERVECMRNNIGKKPLDVTQCAREWHLVLSDRPEDVHKIGVLTYCSHSIADAHGEMILLRQQVDLIGQLEQAPFPLPTSHALHPSHVEWGKEVERLPVTLIEMLGVSVEAFNLDDAITRLISVYKGNFLRLEQGRSKADPILVDTMHTHIDFSEEESEAIHKVAKVHGWSVTQLVDAARHMAYMEMRRDYIEAWRLLPMKETIHADFLLPVNTRADMVKPYSELEYGFVGNATGGFTTSLPLMDPYFISADKEMSLTEEKPLHELSQVRVLAYVTEQLAMQYRQQVKENVLRATSVTPIVVMGGGFSPLYPWQKEAPEGFSSVGVVDRILPADMSLPGHKEPVHVDDWFVGLTMSQHLASLQFSFHVWTLHNKLQLSVIHTNRMTAERTLKFLEIIRSTLKLFVMAYELKGSPIDTPTTPPTPPPRGPLLFNMLSWWNSWFK